MSQAYNEMRLRLIRKQILKISDLLCTDEEMSVEKATELLQKLRTRLNDRTITLATIQELQKVSADNLKHSFGRDLQGNVADKNVEIVDLTGVEDPRSSATSFQ